MNKMKIMKYIKNISLAILAIGFLLFSSCNDFLDVNDNPTKVREASLKVLLPNVIEKTAFAQYQAMLTADRVTHQLDHVSPSTIGQESQITVDKCSLASGV